MNQIKNSTPQMAFGGIKDESARAPLNSTPPIPQHCPMVFMFAAKGDTSRPYFGPLPNHVEHLGDDTFETRGKYFGPSQKLAQLFGERQSFWIWRLAAPGAKTAKIVVTCEVVEDDVPVYQRDINDKVVRDAAGVPQQAGTSTVDGFKLKWGTMEITDTLDISNLQPTPGTMTGKSGATSTVYPMFLLETTEGSAGNQAGFRIYTPQESDPVSYNKRVVKDFKSLIHRVQFFNKSNTGFITTVENRNVANYMDFCLEEGAYDKVTRVDYDFDRILPSYSTTSFKEVSIPKLAPFSQFKVYKENFDTILGLIAPQELTHSGATEIDEKMINILNGVYPDGKECYSFVYDATSIDFDKDKIVFAEGGKDGDTSFEAFDLAARNAFQKSSWTSVKSPLVDRLQFPFSAVYDVGYTLETKFAMIKTLSYRPDFMVYIAPSTHGNPALTISEESSIVQTLMGKVAMNPESVIHGTGACRAFVMNHTGRLINDEYKKHVPLLFEHAIKRSKYAGAGTGGLTKIENYNNSPNNEVIYLEDITNPYQPFEIREKNWNLGANYCQFKNINTLFIPGYQTVYKNQTSVLNNEVAVSIAVDLIKKAEILWTEATGRDTPKEEFSDYTERRFGELISGKYDDRVNIEYNIEFTPYDDNRGYSWTLNVIIYAGVGYTVETLNLIARRFTK